MIPSLPDSECGEDQPGIKNHFVFSAKCIKFAPIPVHRPKEKEQVESGA